MELVTRLSSYCLLISQLWLVYTWCYTDTPCDDVNTAVCDEMGETNTNLCNDPCTRNICKRYCGLCPLICHNCTAIDRPENCRQHKTCSGSDQSCIVMQTVTSSFNIAYTMDCASNTVCKQLYQRRATRNIDLYGGCCDYDLCNKHIPYVDDVARIQTKDVNGPQTLSNRQRNPCTDVHQSLCQILTNTSSCSDECVARLCPETCGRCLTCYSCDNSTKTGHCNVTKTCLPDQVCKITDISVGGSFVQSYKLGCTSIKNCTIDDIHNGYCCNTSTCNSLSVVQTGVTTTLKPILPTQPTSTSIRMTTINSITCYSCKNISNPKLCNQTVTCTDLSQVCMTSMAITSQGDMKFTLGCSDRSGCGKNDIDTCTTTKTYKAIVCCDNGLCNNVYPKDEIRNSGILDIMSGVAATNKVCPPGFYNIPRANSCYHFGETSLTWFQARDYCERLHSHLARIECEDEESLLSSFIDQNYYLFRENINDHLITHGTFYWLDGVRKSGGVRNDTNWFWSSTGKAMTYFNWRPDIPDNIGNRENYIDFGPGEYYGYTKQNVQYFWNDRWYGEKLHPLCEIDF